MARIKALVSFAARGLSAVPGQEYDCPDALAADVIRAGYAVSAESTAAAVEKPKKTRARKTKQETK